MGLGDLIGAQHRRPGLRRGEGHALAHGWIRGDIKQVRERSGGLPEGRVFGHVPDSLAIDENLPAVAQRAEIFVAFAHQPLRMSVPHVLSHDLAVLAARPLFAKLCKA